MSNPSTPQRLTRSKSSQPQPLGSAIAATDTAPGPPVPSRDSSIKPNLAVDAVHPSNPFQVDLVIPFSISAGKDRVRDQAQVKEQYEALLRALEGEGGLKVASRPGRTKGKGAEEIWIFVGAADEKVSELAERERSVVKLDH